MIFHALYNFFHKKVVDENLSYVMPVWPKKPAYCYDMSLENLKDYYTKFTANIDFDDAIILDFGTLLNKSNILKFLRKINVATTEDTEVLIDSYLANQITINLETIGGTTMEDIIAPIPDEYFLNSPWFVAYCIFRFELINCLRESQRLWTIDQLPLIGKLDLIKLSYQYKFD